MYRSRILNYLTVIVSPFTGTYLTSILLCIEFRNYSNNPGYF